MSVPTIIVTGPVGVGKTTIAGEMGLLLQDANVPHANVNLDELRAWHPRPVDDRGFKVGLANLTALWKNYEAAGARRLLIATVIESRSELDDFRRAVPGADIRVVRLRAAPSNAPGTRAPANAGAERDRMGPQPCSRSGAANL